MTMSCKKNFKIIQIKTKTRKIERRFNPEENMVSSQPCNPRVVRPYFYFKLFILVVSECITFGVFSWAVDTLALLLLSSVGEIV